jgi:hypothetical protein
LPPGGVKAYRDPKSRPAPFKTTFAVLRRKDNTFYVSIQILYKIF